MTLLRYFQKHYFLTSVEKPNEHPNREPKGNKRPRPSQTL